MRQEIEEYRLQRQIPYLLHFTRAANLPSILANGLVPRCEIDGGARIGLTNDPLRLDGRRGFNCLSITFPNHLMFYRLRAENPGVEWPVLVVHPAVMSYYRTLFCWQNAATGEMSRATDDYLTSLPAFRGMFEEREGHVTRSSQFLKISDPTHVQAEVLVEGTIPPEAIYHVIFSSYPCLRENAHLLGERKFSVSGQRGFYGTRTYYRQWGEGKNG